MSNHQTNQIQGPVALKNVAAFMAMTTRLIERSPHLPGFGVCHGPSGFGKTYASIFAQNRVKATRIEVGDSWTRRTLLHRVLREFGERPKERTPIAELAEMARGALGQDSSRPLIVDEADKLVDKGMIEILRELQEESGAPVILIGEEKLPTKLLAVERMHNRVLHWFSAEPCDLDDTRVLAGAFAPKVEIKDDLLDTIRMRSGGRARRIVVNLDHAAVVARNAGLKTLDLKLWGAEDFYTGEPPAPRHVEAYPRRAGGKAVA
ncbi:ATP-binding protein [Bradyrhizobium ontarionense]|uniref:ATP-binding protein n=1 Tax=Bradyrhizobium ontarionense TaxID=2898149 RepID=A0ABY3RDL2_9BRAD|nr:ATP-binding protein [Bradyrhizobium sp. A19]UFZ05476.1 ATP-binding protein [Bradyrhizobium sp. A19]